MATPFDEMDCNAGKLTVDSELDSNCGVYFFGFVPDLVKLGNNFRKKNNKKKRNFLFLYSLLQVHEL